MKNKNFAEAMSVLSLVLKVIGAITGILAVFLLIWKIFGHSPTFESVIIFIVSLLTALVCAIIALLFNVVYKLGRVEVEIVHIKRMLFALIKDFKEFRSHA